MISPLTLEGKIVFITGSTRGIGWSTAQFLARQGATILLNGVSDDEVLQSRIQELKASFSIDCDGFLFSVADRDSVKKCYSDIFKKYKKLDVLINNAGVLESSLLAMATEKMIDKTLDINVKGVLYNMQNASRLMARQKSGSIINLTSIMGQLGSEGQTVYSGSKAAIIGITLSAAKELAAQNIRVNAVSPGFIDTDMAKDISSDKFEERINSIRMQRIGTPEEVAKVIYFFASDLSSYVTGQVLGVDGGMVI
jgi:3-oxoacyl-[acyl-carrier protein] reductase